MITVLLKGQYNCQTTEILGFGGYGSLYVTLCFVLCTFDFRVFVC